MSIPTTLAASASSPARDSCTRTGVNPGRGGGRAAAIQADRDPAAPAGVHSGYAHTPR